jgi:hypothetical protein
MPRGADTAATPPRSPLRRRRSGLPVRRVVLAPHTGARLRLEVLSAAQLHAVLALTYGSVVVAALLGFIEQQPYGFGSCSSLGIRCGEAGWAARQPTQQTTCVSAPQNWTGPGGAVSFIDATTASLSIKLNHTNRFFKLGARVQHRTEAELLNSSWELPVQVVGNVSGHEGKGHGGHAAADMMPAWSSVANWSDALTLRCEAGRSACGLLTLYEMDFIAFQEYRLNLTFNATDLLAAARQRGEPGVSILESVHID